MKVQLVVHLYANCIIVSLFVISYANDFLLMLMINRWARLKVSLVAIVHPLMLLSTYAVLSR